MTLIQKSDIENIINRFGHVGHGQKWCEIRNIEQYRQAFVHSSYCGMANSNERLEFLGDSVLGNIVSQYLFKRFPEQQEGFLTKIRTKIVRSSALADVASKLNFDKFLLTNFSSGSGETTSENMIKSPKLLEDCFEAFIGAMSLDFDDSPEIVHRFIKSCVEQTMDFSHLILYNENHKDILQRYYQSIQLQNPLYLDIEEIQIDGCRN